MLKALFLLIAACDPDPEPAKDPPIDPPVVPQWPTVWINEVMASNATAWADPEASGCAEYDDWVELFVDEAGPADLQGWRLVEGEEALVFGPGGVGPHLLVVADGEPEQGPLHAPFKLDVEGEELRLLRPDGSEADRMSWTTLDADRSWGRNGDGEPLMVVQPDPTPGAANLRRSDDPCLAPDPAFDDHTARCLPTVEAFLGLAGRRVGFRTVKFEILSFSDPAARRVLFPDGAFYQLHDEWYLYRMLNGQSVEGEDLFEPWPGDFDSVDAIYDWARGIDLAATFDPFFIRWAGDRLTSQRFYAMALTVEPRLIGLGVLTLVPARTEPPLRPEIWGFELEFGDDISYEELVVYFEALGPVLPPGVGGQLRWLVRSQSQERLAKSMEEGGMAYADRVMRYAELSVPGEVVVYNPGVAAGRVKMVRAGGDLGGTGEDDLLVLAEIPDDLPPGGALITNLPQTPLSHVSLLAESRGIPNVYAAGVTEDAQWDQWQRVRAWVGIRAVAPGVLQAVGLTEPQIAKWRLLTAPVVPVLEPVDADGLPWTLPLTGLPIAQMPELRGAIGGKSAGIIALLDADDVAVPDAPVAVTVRAGMAHQQAVGLVDLVLSMPDFLTPDNGRLRYLVLEGQAAYLLRFGAMEDDPVLVSALATWPPEDPLGRLVRGGGLRGAFVDLPVAAEVLEPIEEALRAAYAHLAPAQELRFRSSSNVEDAEGFNGAGLYASYSGWIDPPASDPEATVERALQQVWGSYWGAEAFEERQAAGFDHRAGAMGVLVHPQFDDRRELANGVVTVTRLPGEAASWEMTVNTQWGAISVTNPPPAQDCRSILPETARLSGEESPVIQRVAASTEVPAGHQVMSDVQLLELYRQLTGVVERWLEAENARLDPAWRRSTLTLDYEFRQMGAGWPALADGSVRPGATYVKQARTLEPGLARVPEDVRALPFPRDLLARAAMVQRVTCLGDVITVVAEEVYTDPLMRPDMGFGELPFTASLTVQVTDDVAEVGWTVGQSWTVLHTDMGLTHAAGGDWAIEADLGGLSPLAGGRLAVASDGSWTFSGPDGAAAGGMGTCVGEVLWSSPEDWLEGVIDAALP